MKHLPVTTYCRLLCALACVSVYALVSCSDTETYADLVSAEKRYISNFLQSQHIDDIVRWDEDKVDAVTSSILSDKDNPDQYVELGQWYEVTEGDFKRLYFKVIDWGNGYPDMGSPKKYKTGSNALVRYDSCYYLNTFTSLNTGKIDNLDPNSYEIIYSWRAGYYASTYETYYNTIVNNYQCTSGGLAFPLRFLWEGGKAAVIVPFSIGSSTDQTYYYTVYYGLVTYPKMQHNIE